LFGRGGEGREEREGLVQTMTKAANALLQLLGIRRQEGKKEL